MSQTCRCEERNVLLIRICTQHLYTAQLCTNVRCVIVIVQTKLVRRTITLTKTYTTIVGHFYCRTSHNYQCTGSRYNYTATAYICRGIRHRTRRALGFRARDGGHPGRERHQTSSLSPQLAVPIRPRVVHSLSQCSNSRGQTLPTRTAS